ncbi:MAG: hypothetical protein WA988_19595 [Candidatus Nanopelagicales bacterium]
MAFPTWLRGAKAGVPGLMIGAIGTHRAGAELMDSYCRVLVPFFSAAECVRG